MNRDSATTQSRLGCMLSGAALGALAMYFADPVRGRRRRALVTDKMQSVLTQAGDAVDVASRDLGNRMQGLRARASGMLFRSNIAADDQVLVARVRQKLGRILSHPHAVQVTAQQGCITLGGPVLASELQQLLNAVRRVPGVADINDNLEVHEQPGNISSLQGGGRPRASAARENWTPALRALALMGGSALGMVGLTKRTPANALFTAAGLALMARSIGNMPFSRMAGMSAGQAAINLHKTLHIKAPPDKVFDLWSNYANFPHFMSTVKEVRDMGNGRSHWIVCGPAGSTVEWDAKITESRRPELLAWSSERDAAVRNCGTIHFEPDQDGTRVSIQMSYTPPAGILGHAVASMFSSDPKRQMDDDLMRMKAFIETGIAPRDAAQPAR